MDMLQLLFLRECAAVCDVLLGNVLENGLPGTARLRVCCPERWRRHYTTPDAAAGQHPASRRLAHTAAAYPSEMAQNFWTAIWAFTVCFVVTVAVSLITRPRAENELVGLVYSLTPPAARRRIRHAYARPGVLGLGVARRDTAAQSALLVRSLAWASTSAYRSE